ncbi:Sentrin-specific protease [Termitomyces sp. J132]|nr:Sentrin-specific protease [Termitomyces sp. J132]
MALDVAIELSNIMMIEKSKVLFGRSNDGINLFRSHPASASFLRLPAFASPRRPHSTPSSPRSSRATPEPAVRTHWSSMNPRKRPAEAPLLPLHSTKQRRTRMVGYDGENSSAAQETSLLARWKDFCKQFSVLASDTVKAMVYPVRPITPCEPESPSTPPLHRSSSASPTRISSHRPQEQAFQSDRSRRTSTVLYIPDREFRQLHASFFPTNHVIERHSTLGASFTSETHLSHNETPSGRDKPPVNGVLPVNSGRKNDASGLKPRPYSSREHIFAKKHKATVAAEKQKIKEEMQQKLYTIKRNSGLLAFQEELERLEHRDALSPSSSMIDLHAKERESSPRRYSDTDNLDFLRLAIDRAKATLNEPRPPRPFQPTLEQLRLSQRLKDENIEQSLRPKPVPPTPLPLMDDAQVDIILKKRGVVSKYAREQVNDTDLSRLQPGQWLNDEIINFYGALLLGRSDEFKENPPKQKVNGSQVLNIYYFSTFFWPKLKEGYEKGRLAKWTKKVDIFSKDVILIPVNHSNAHWTSAAINFRKKRIESYDSMGTRRDGVFKACALRAYLDAEHRNKKKTPFDFTGWVDHSIDEPQQENGGDDAIRFTQRDMPALRRRMIWEIAHAKLRDDP